MKKGIFINKKNKFILLFALLLLLLIIGSGYLFSEKVFKNQYQGQIAKSNASKNEYRETFYFDKNGGTGGTDSITWVMDKDDHIEVNGVYGLKLVDVFLDNNEQFSGTIKIPTRTGYRFNGYRNRSGENEIGIAFDGNGYYVGHYGFGNSSRRLLCSI